MSKLSKALKSYNAGMRHAYLHVGFRRTDRDIDDYNTLVSEKTVKIGKAQREKRSGGVIARSAM